MNNYVVSQPASKFREVARGALSGKWGLMFAGMLIYFLFSTVMETVLNYFFHILRYVELIDGYYYTLQINYAGNLYSMLVSGPLTCGLIMFLMACFRDKKIDYGLTLEGFGMALVFAVCYSGHHSHFQIQYVLLSEGRSSRLDGGAVYQRERTSDAGQQMEAVYHPVFFYRLGFSRGADFNGF